MKLARVYVDGDGWVIGSVNNEGPKFEPDGGYDVTPEEEGMFYNCSCMYYDTVNGLCCPRDDRVAWKALRRHGHKGSESCGIISNVVGGMRSLPDIPQNVSIPVIDPIVHPLFPAIDIGEVPGLRIVPVTYKHLDEASALAIETGLYPGVCPGPTDDHPFVCSPPEAHAWMHIAAMIDNNDGMAMALEYKGIPLQIEILKIDGPTVTMGFTVHHTRERPHWFWREAEKPVFDALRAMGFTKLQSFIRRDRADWVENLKINYGATEQGGTPELIKLEMPLDGHFQGWPARRTMGAGWTYPEGGLIVREADESDLPAIISFLDSSYGAQSERLSIVKKMLDWWYNLDKATILIGIEGGEIEHVRVIRHRRGTVSSVGLVSKGGSVSGPFINGMRTWQAGVGYTKGTMLVPEKIMGAQDIQDALNITQAKGTTIVKTHTQFRENFVEIEWDCP